MLLNISFSQFCTEQETLIKPYQSRNNNDIYSFTLLITHILRQHGFSFNCIIPDSKPLKYQSLPKKDGYVPVYIRVGNTPLEQINRDLAAAFQESNARSIRGTVIQQLNRDARFSSESSSEEATNLIPKLLDPNYRSISDSNSNSNESNSSEILLNYIASLKPGVAKPAVAKTAVVSNNVI